MEIPGLGEITKDDEFGWHYSDWVPIPVFGGLKCSIVLEGYDEDENQADFHVAIANFLAATPAVLRQADEPLYRYYKDFEEWWLADGNQPIERSKVWQHIRFGCEPMVSRRQYGDRGIYISVECECDWEQEHGLQLVLRNGIKVNKLGGYDGHLTNSDAFDDNSLENVIYR